MEPDVLYRKIRFVPQHIRLDFVIHGKGSRKKVHPLVVRPLKEGGAKAGQLSKKRFLRSSKILWDFKISRSIFIDRFLFSNFESLFCVFKPRTSKYSPLDCTFIQQYSESQFDETFCRPSTNISIIYVLKKNSFQFDWIMNIVINSNYVIG